MVINATLVSLGPPLTSLLLYQITNRNLTPQQLWKMLWNLFCH